jgi:hypothetical protein
MVASEIHLGVAAANIYYSVYGPEMFYDDISLSNSQRRLLCKMEHASVANNMKCKCAFHGDT